MTIAVTGATGQLGRLVVDKAEGQDRRGHRGARSARPRKRRGLGVAVREADYAKPANAETGARGRRCAAFDLFQRNRPAGRATPQRDRGGESRRREAHRLYRVSSMRTFRQSAWPSSTGRPRRSSRAPGIPHTILRNGWYTENHTVLDRRRAERAAPSSEARGTASFRPRRGPTTRRPPSRRSPAKVTTARPMSSPATRPIRFRTSLPRFRGRQARPSPTRICRRPNMRRRSPDSACRRRSRRRSRAGTSTRRTGALFDGSRQLSALIGRPTTPLSSAVAEALAAVSKA